MTQPHWKPQLAKAGAGGGGVVEVTRPWDGAVMATVEKAGGADALSALETSHAVS